MSERRPNTAPIRYDRWQLEQLMRREGVSGPKRQRILDQYEHVRTHGKDRPCQSVVHHGPGHQSSTYCQVKGGEKGHDVIDGKVTHFANLPSGGQAEWTDDRPYAEYWG